MQSADNETTEQQVLEPVVTWNPVMVARLDANRVFQGMDFMHPDDVTAAHLVLPNGCDLQPGTHWHDEERNTFVPLEGKPARAPEENPQALRAVALGFIATWDQGLTLPPETLKWLDWFMTSIDFAGMFDERTAQMIERYKKARKGE